MTASTPTRLPDPTGVSTVPELANELQILRIYHGRSVRDLGKKAGISSSTVQDALTGKRGLPKQETVLAIVAALGVDLPPWRDAWVRVKMLKTGLPYDAPPRSRRPAAPTGTTQISAVNTRRGANLIETLPDADVVEQLAAMGARDAAERLNLVSPERTANILVVLAEKLAAEIVFAMDRAAAAAALVAMSPAEAATIVDHVAPDRLPDAVAALPPEAAAQIVLAADGWTDRMARMIRLRNDPQDANSAIKILMVMPFEKALEFVRSNRRRSPIWIANAPPEFAARLLTAVSTTDAATWLARIDANALAAAVGALADERLGPIIAKMREISNDTETVLKALGPDKLVALVPHMDKNGRGAWARALRGKLTPDAARKLAVALRQDRR